jgi:signal transduction histidine kinase
MIQKEVDRLNNLVKDVLLFSRQGDLMQADFVFTIFVEGLHSQLKGLLEEKNIDFEFEGPEIKIRGDVEKLKQVFLNILLNAVDAIYENGKIRIVADVDADRDMLIIDVIDNGSGVPYPEKLFEPFHTTKNLGTGLGLSISQNILKNHKGSLFLLRSKPTETIFRIELPYNQTTQ